MASYTPNYNLKKPATTDIVDIDDINGNMDTIDTTMKALDDHIAIQQVGSKQNVAINDEITLSSAISSYSVLYVSIVKTDWGNALLNGCVIPAVLANNIVTLTARSANDGLLLGLQKTGDNKIKVTNLSASGGWSTDYCTLIIFGRK